MSRFLVPALDSIKYPSNLNAVQSLILAGNKYYSEPLNNLQVLDPQERHGTVRAPRQGRCYDFDGVDDVATLGRRLTTGAVSKLFLSVRFNVTDTDVQRGLISEYLTNSSADRTFRLVVTTANQIRLFYSDNGLTFSNPVMVQDAITEGQDYHLSVYFNQGALQAWLDGVQTADTSTAFTTMFDGIAPFTIGMGFNETNEPWLGKIWDVRVYEGDAAEEAYANRDTIYNDPTAFIGSPTGHYWCNEENGTTAYDSSGNGNHLTLTNVTQATFHAIDSGVTYNANNEFGYRLDGGVYIPAAGNLAANGQALTASGKSPYPATVETPCVTGNGTDVEIDISSLFNSGDLLQRFSCWFYRTGETTSANTARKVLLSSAEANQVIVLGDWSALLSEEVIAVGDSFSNRTGVVDIPIPAGWNKLDVVWNGTKYDIILNGVQQTTTSGTSVGDSRIIPMNGLALMAGQIADTRFFFDGRIADVEIETDSGITYYFPLQDGPGTNNENRNIAWVASDGTGGVLANAIVNGTVSTIWANRCPGHARDWSVQYGGRIGAGGEVIAGKLNGTESVDGNALTLAPGKYGNPYSRINLNPFTAAEYNGRSIPTALAPGGDGWDDISPTDSAFRRVMVNGDDRFVVFDSRSLGNDLIRMGNYVLDQENLTLHLDFTRAVPNVVGPLPTWARSGNIATYRDANGVMQVALANTPRYDHELEDGVWVPKGLLVESSSQNKCTNFNANPTDLTGVTLIGDAAATLTLVDDSAALETAGLGAVCSSGMVYRLDNSAGSDFAFAVISGGVGNTNPHSVSCFIRGGSGFLGLRSAITGAFISGQTEIPSPTSYQRISHVNATPDNSGRVAGLSVAAGSVVYFILNQLEESTFVTTPIITEGSAVTRGSDLHILYGLDTWFNHDAGTFVVEFDSPAPGTKVLLTATTGSVNDRIAIVLTGNTATNSRLTVGGVEKYQTSVDAELSNASVATYAYQLNDAQHACNGVLATPGTPDALPAGLNRVWLGFQSSLAIYGHIKRVLYYNVRKPNTWVQGTSSR